MLSQFINQFLVLGLIPGTNLQITFSDLLFMIDVALVAYLFRHKLPSARSVYQALSYYYLYIRIYLSAKKGQQLTLPV